MQCSIDLKENILVIWKGSKDENFNIFSDIIRIWLNVFHLRNTKGGYRHTALCSYLKTLFLLSRGFMCHWFTLSLYWFKVCLAWFLHSWVTAEEGSLLSKVSIVQTMFHVITSFIMPARFWWGGIFTTYPCQSK